MTLKEILTALNFEGYISLRLKGSHGFSHLGGGDTQKICSRYGSHKIEKTVIIDNILVIYLR